MKRTLPLLIASVAGFVVVVAYFIPAIEGWRDTAAQWFSILAAVAVILGGANLLKVHLKEIFARKPGWGYSAVTALAFLITVTIGLLKVGVPPLSEFPDRPWAGQYNDDQSALQWIYDALIVPITSTMYGMLAFYVASAAFRAFRAKNLEASLLLGTAIIVLLGQTQLGTLLGLDPLNDTIQVVFNTAGTRAIKIGVALGIVATALRILLGLDRSYLGGDE
jgi:hypothetical protein